MDRNDDYEDEPVREFVPHPTEVDCVYQDEPADVLEALIQREEEGDFRLIEPHVFSPYEQALVMSAQ